MNAPLVGYKGNVNTWECDENGHLNVRHYVAKAESAHTSLAAALGLAPAHLREHGLALAPTEQHLRFLREARPAAPLTGRIGLVTVDAQAIDAVVELVSSVDGSPHATVTSRLRLEDRAGTPQELGQPALDRAQALLITRPEHSAPRGLDTTRTGTYATLADAERMGLLEITRDVVHPWQCDHRGWLETAHFVGSVSDGIVNFLTHFQDPETLDARGAGRIGGAVLEYRLLYHRRARAGDLLSVRSGVAALAEKTHSLVHWLFDAASGRLLCSSEAVAIALDLVERRAMPIPAAQRARMESLRIDGLGI